MFARATWHCPPARKHCRIALHRVLIAPNGSPSASAGVSPEPDIFSSAALQASETWMLSLGKMLSGIGDHSSAQLVRRCAGPLVIACLTTLLALVVGLLLLVWKVRYGAHDT